jgi:hypothetical protein
MESSVFNPRIFLGSVATAGVLVVGAAMPAFAAGQLSHHHPLKQAEVVAATSPVHGVTTPVQGALGGTPAGSALSSTPAGGILGALAGLPVIGPLFSAFADGISGGSADENPLSGALHGLSTGTGLGSVASGIGGAVGGTIDSIAKAIPGGSKITSLLPGGSATGALNGITGGLSGITNAVPGIGSVTSALPKAGS